MGIVPTFSDNVIAQKIAKFQSNLESAVIFMLRALGEELVAYAKDNHTYTDQTGNLTNSIGFVVVKQSKIVYSDGNKNQPGEGAANALKVAIEMAARASDSFSLIIVAGMDYASYVEAKGYNVILPAELKCKHDFPAAMLRLQNKARGKANELFGNIL